MRLTHMLYDLRRRFRGTWSIEDPRPVQKTAPYTFFLPTPEEIMALRPGDLVKLTIKGSPPGRQYEAERMWLIVDALGPEEWSGRLDNQPHDMPQLRPGTVIHFQPFHIIDYRYEGDVARDVLEFPPVREYWDRCLVDRCVLDDGVPIQFLYREEPDMAEEGDAWPDSGWRIRGDYRDLSDEELEARPLDYIALGKILNIDDSWLSLIDAPVGAAFLRNFETGAFEPAD